MRIVVAVVIIGTLVLMYYGSFYHDMSNKKISRTNRGSIDVDRSFNDFGYIYDVGKFATKWEKE